MTPSVLPNLDTGASRPVSSPPLNSASGNDASEIKQRFEQMLWAEMLSHAGLEKALTQSGGEAASAFSRYVVEEIAKDLAEKFPMGLANSVDAPSAQAAPLSESAT